MRKNFNLHGGRRGAALAVRVYPGAQHDEITEISPDGAIQVMLRSNGRPAEINAGLTHFLAEILSVKKNQVEVVAGEQSLNKLVSVLDISTETAHARIINNLS